MTDITHQPCPHPDCMSSDAFSYSTEKQVGKCHSCGEPYPAKGVKYSTETLEAYPLSDSTDTTNRTKVSKKPVPDITQMMVTTTSRRSITESVMKFYGVTHRVDNTGEVVAEVYPYPGGGKKTRYVEDKEFTSMGLKMDELFGMDKFNGGSAKAVTITEGELDALSSFQMQGSKYPVVSLPSATPSKNLLVKCKDWLGSFDKIVLSFDNDGKSDHIAGKLSALFPNRVYIMNHDAFKDANEFLQAGKSKEYQAAWFNARKYVPENTFNTTEDFLSIYRDTEESDYVPTSIQAFDDMALGLMQGHFTVFQAPEGIGKTEFIRYLEYQMWKAGVPFACSHLEEKKKRSLLGLVSYHVGLNLTRQDLIDAMAATADVEKAISELTSTEDIWQFDLDMDDPIEDLYDKIRFFSTACDCKFMFIEPIQDIGMLGMGDGGDTLERTLSNMSTKLAIMAKELNIGIVTVAHSNDDGEIRDCRMIGKRASVVVKLSRDKLAADEDKRNLTGLLLVKNRPAAATGQAGYLRFDPETFLLSEEYGEF